MGAALEADADAVDGRGQRQRGGKHVGGSIETQESRPIVGRYSKKQ
jgi:hypothetical protein